MPERIQRRRMAGWRMPEGAVCVTRPSKYGNPIIIRRRKGEDGRWEWKVTGSPRYRSGPAFNLQHTARHEAKEQFKADLLRWRDIKYPSIDEIVRELAGKDLACWCPLGEPCHADILLEIANGGDRG